MPTKGIRTTFGSPIYDDNVPAEDHAAGRAPARPRARSRSARPTRPEFGAGSQTFNKVFGATRNPYDLTQDLRRLLGRRGGRGRLRHAALRRRRRPRREPAQPRQLLQRGRLPPDAGPRAGVAGGERLEHARRCSGRSRAPSTTARFSSRPWPGPIRARRSPSPSRATSSSSRSSETSRKTRIAWSRDLGGLPVDPRVTVGSRAAETSLQGPRLHRRGSRARLHRRHRGLRDAARGRLLAARYGPLLKEHRDKLKDTVIWNIEQGLRLQRRERRARRGAALGAVPAHARRSSSATSSCVCPVNQLPPYPVETEWPREVAGVKMDELPRLDEELLLHHHHQPPGDLGAGGLHAATACRWASRSSAATATTSACCSSRTPSSRRRRPGSGARRSPAEVEKLSKAHARRIWLRAQRLDEPAPFGGGPEATPAAVEHLGYVQIDTINVVERCHHQILYTRIPDYQRAHLHRAQTRRQDRLRVLDARALVRADARLPLLRAGHEPALDGSQLLVRPGDERRPAQGADAHPPQRRAHHPRHRRRRAGGQDP